MFNFSTVGDFDAKGGNMYLFTYFDENNPTDIFEVTGYDTSKLKLKNVEGEMWERFEKYLNESRYSEAEQERLDRQNEALPIEGDDISFVELIGVSKEEAETVKIHYNGEVHKIGVNKFYKAIDDIVLNDIADVPMDKKYGDKIILTNGMYITVNGFDGFAFVSDDCKVDKCGMHYSRLPFGAYTMKSGDRKKIVELFADEYKKPFIGTSLFGKWFYIILVAVVLVVTAVVAVSLIKRRKSKKRLR